MNDQEELIYQLHRNIDDLYMHEDDAQYIRDNLEDWEKMEYASEEDAESEADSEDQAAHQLYHVIECELNELSDILGRKVKLEDFTDGEFKS